MLQPPLFIITEPTHRVFVSISPAYPTAPSRSAWDTRETCSCHRTRLVPVYRFDPAPAIDDDSRSLGPPPLSVFDSSSPNKLSRMIAHHGKC